jgi:predicted nucleic acid-binding protein
VILVDTSVWIEVFRKQKPLPFESLVDFSEVVTCLPVIQEVLQGFKDESAFRKARIALVALPMVESPMTDGLFIEAAQLYRAGRRAGQTIRSSTDCLIAACAIRHDLELLHSDRDYAALAQVSPLRQRQITQP